MKILLIAIGTRGDIQPFIVIGSRLKADGHDVHIATAESFSPMIAAQGLAHHPLPVDFQELLQEPEMQAALSSFSGKLKAYRWASNIMNDQLSAMWQIGLDVEPELILYHFKGAMGPYLGRHLGVPAWPVMLQPGFAPTRAYPQFLIAKNSLGPVGNLLSHKLIGAVTHLGTNMMIKRWVKATGTDIGTLLNVQAGFAPGGSPLRLHAYSPHVVPLGPDMADTERQVGYAFAEPEAFTPPEGLETFLSAGDTPIYVGFGSMPGVNQDKVNAALLGALDRTGLRAVVATGWGGIGGQDGVGPLSEHKNLYVLEAVPHTWLFPRVAAVVHHGGSGTTHEGLRWGRASVVCPVFADQPFFGQRIADLGAGPTPIAQKRLAAEGLAHALEQALSKKMTARAEAFAPLMRDENGAQTITELVRRSTGRADC